MRKQFVIIGLGRFGHSIARTLTEMNHEVLAIDNDEEHINEILAQGHATQAFCLDSTNLHALQRVGMEHFDAVILAIGEDIQASILTALNLLEMGVEKLTAKASTFNHGKILKRIGVPNVIYPEADMAERLAKSLVQENILETIELDPRYSILEIKTPVQLVGKTLAESHLRVMYGIHVIAIKQNMEVDIVPDPAREIKKDDLLVVIGPTEQLRKLMSE